MRFLAVLTLALSAADHWTTYVCLCNPVSGWQVTEANPISSWLFAQLGLVPGLLFDSAITVVATVFVVATNRLPGVAKKTFFSLVIAATAYAVANNLQAISALGLSPLGNG